MKAVQMKIWLKVIRSIGFVFLISTACLPLAGDPLSSQGFLEGTVSGLETETSRLATLVTGQKQMDDTQQGVISQLNTLMPSKSGYATAAPTPLPLFETSTPYPVCTPPACAPDEMYHCPGDCPGGCGTTCATVTPGISSGSGQVWGKICFPDDRVPPMTLYFQEINTLEITALSTAENQASYELVLSAGVYLAFAWLPDKETGGSYSHFVPCNQNASCTDHNLVPFLVQENHVTTGVDICDWNGDTTLFPTLKTE